MGYLAGYLLDLADGGEIDVLGGEYHGGVAGVNAGVFDMLAHCIFHHFALVGHGIKLYLLGLLHELGNYHGIFLAHLGGHLQESLQFLIAVAYVHGGTGENVRRTYQYGIAYLADELLDVVQRGEGTPCGLVDT